MVDVFISYSRTDLAAVTRLARAVEAEGYDVWWDADLPPHLSYGDVITDKIGMAKAAIVVWSKDSAASQWVRAEADMARNQKKLIQVAIDSVMPPLPFNQIQYAELGDWKGEPDHPGWRKVKVSLTELCGKKSRTRRSKSGAAAEPEAVTLAAAPQAASALSAVPTARADGPPPGALIPPKTPKGVIYGGIGALAVILALAIGLQMGSGGSSAPATTGAPGQASALVSPTTQGTTAPTTAGTTTSGSTDGQDRHVTIANNSSQTVMQFYASPVTSENWEEDMLGANVLSSGTSINANIDNGTNECNYDLKAVMADGQEHIQNGVNVCAVSQWNITDSGNSTS